MTSGWAILEGTFILRNTHASMYLIRSIGNSGKLKKYTMYLHSETSEYRILAVAEITSSIQRVQFVESL